MLKSLLPAVLLLISTASFSKDNQTVTVDLPSLQRSNWSELEQKNAKLVTDFVQNLMNEHNFDYVLQHYNDSAYRQHNRNLPDKVTGLVAFLQEFVEEYPDYSYEVKHIYVDGDYVIFHSHATLNKEDRGDDQKGMNIIDTWRIDQGRIVEHWDSIQALDLSMRFYSLLKGGDIQNSNGVF